MVLVLEAIGVLHATVSISSEAFRPSVFITLGYLGVARNSKHIK
jgi:hypothetical protein